MDDNHEARIVYEDPVEGTVERDVENEHLAYFQDHWLVKLDEDEAGNDIVRRIPLQRVHYVERSVEEFEDEVSTLKRQVVSAADDLRSKVFGSGRGDHREPHRIDVEDPDER